MKRLKILFLKVGLRAYNHYLYYPCTAFSLLSGILKERCANEVDEIRIIDGSIKFRRVDELLPTLDDYNPDIVGITCLSFNHQLLLEFVSLIKKYNPTITVIVGGPLATLECDKVITDSNIDFVVIGEGEETLCELITGIAHGAHDFKGIKGIAYKKNNVPVTTQSRPVCNDLSALYRYNDHESINYDDYEGLMNDIISTGKRAPLMTSRGCPYACAYCHGINGKTVRRRTVESVINEIEYLVKEKDFKYFSIDDDIFNIDLPWAKRFAKTLIKRKFNIKIAFPNGLRPDRMDEELIDLLVAAGTNLFRYAIDTASLRLQQLMRRNLDLNKAMKTIKYSVKTPAIVEAFFMLGFPTETKDDLASTLAFVEKTGIFHPIFNFVQISSHTYLEELYNNYVVTKKANVLSSETQGKYHTITNNGFCYSTEYLNAQYCAFKLKILSDPEKVAMAYKKLSANFKDDDMKIYFSLRYMFPNRANVRLHHLPHNRLGEELRTIAKNSIPLVMKGFGK